MKSNRSPHHGYKNGADQGKERAVPFRLDFGEQHLAGAAFSKLKIGKVKPGNVCLAVMLVYILTVFLPAYKDKYIQEKTSNDTLEATLNAVGDGISGESICGTLEANRDYWLFLSKEADEQFAEDLIREGYCYEEIMKNGVLGTHRVFVYHLIPI